MNRMLYFLPIVPFAILVFVFYRSLSGPPPDELPSALLDKPAPQIALPALDTGAKAFTPADLRAGRVSIVNVWASWCVPCRVEAPALAELGGRKDIQLYGLVYRDTAAKARGFLDEVGNPFSRIDLDSDGRAGIEWGVYGVPETFVIDGKGIIRLRFAGPLVGNAMGDTILPAIARARAAS